MSAPYRIRAASPADLDTLVEFTQREAAEAEGVALDPADVARGVGAAFLSPPLSTYWVAEAADGRVVASASVVKEWSNFRGGHYWWIQSLFVDPAHRGSGLVDRLLAHLTDAAAEGGALDLRLYARASNHRALHVYRRCGFETAPYALMTRRVRPGAPRAGAADPHDLDRFVTAQASDYARALSEIRAGRKRSHWMWYVFPQYDGLGRSATSRRYAIRSLDEARAYLRHPVLGPRLVECAEAVVALAAPSASAVFPPPDDLKLRSCATLFAAVTPAGSVFARLLGRFFEGHPDAETLRLIGPRDTP